ncbi:MAG: hypothetical protein C4293_09870, partial [Nitrospiraceae bacterium]
MSTPKKSKTNRMKGRPTKPASNAARDRPRGGGSRTKRKEDAMAEVNVKKSQEKKPEESRALATERERWGVPSLFSLTPREFFSASPFELMRRFSEEMDRMFESMSPWRLPARAGTAVWSPPIDIYERDGNLVVSAELPGLSKEDVKVEATPEGLILEGERKQEREERRGGVYRSERSYGRFYRM